MIPQPVQVNLSPLTIQLIQRTLPMTVGMHPYTKFCSINVDGKGWMHLTLSQLLAAVDSVGVK